MFRFISNWVKLRVQLIIINLPWRMALGRLGIRLMQVGRFLQVGYANWNREFRLKFDPWVGSKQYGTFHVSEPLTDFQKVSFQAKGAQPSLQTPLVRALFNIQGVAAITFSPYEVQIRKAEVFGWGELQSQIEAVLLEHLTRRQRDHEKAFA